MPRSLIFWILMLLWALSIFGPWRTGYWYASALLEFVLFALLGWAVYGPAVKD